MPWPKKTILDVFADDGFRFLRGSLHGLERECLRVDYGGNLSLKPHPAIFGSPLCHPYISTDFSEAQLELITPPFRSERRALSFLHDIERYVANNLDDEHLWPSSAPGLLPSDDDIPIARYGVSRLGEKKEVYRRGLGYRYGRKMQTLSGIHYNFSFSDDFWGFLHTSYGKGLDRTGFISASYLALIRNFLREGWLSTYLFGATPATDASFFDVTPSSLQRLGGTYYGEHATSLRMSRYGYYSKVQAQKAISFDDLSGYLRDINDALTTSHQDFKDIGLYDESGRRQLNDYILQSEAEHYSRIRPKPHLTGGESASEALKNRGIAYVEVRNPDISPFVAEGIDIEHLRFLHIFMVYCLFKESPPISCCEQKTIVSNQDNVAVRGRDITLRLHRGKDTLSVEKWGCDILDDMEAIAALMDKNYSDGRYCKVIKKQKAKILNPSLTPSARILEEIKDSGSFTDTALSYAERHMEDLKEKPLLPRLSLKLSKLAQKSLQKKKELEMHDDLILKGYEDLEVSTQALIREALKRGITVEVIDRKDSFIKLTKGDTIEYVKQATKTSKDSLMSYLLMESKAMTKHVLEENGINTPAGAVYHSPKDAIEDYDRFSSIKVAIKPNFTNYGIGISFCSHNDPKLYEKAVLLAFKHSDEILVEEFIEGDEYRFLVIDGNVSAICKRIPANVVGDGIHTIKQLIRTKNKDEIYPIRTEKTFLAKQDLTVDDIPKKGSQTFLRSNSNVSTGGDSIDTTDDIPIHYKDIAITAAHSVDATFCGVDMIIANPSQPPSKNNHSIIELNFNPALLIHRYPTFGKKQYVEKDVLNTLGF